MQKDVELLIIRKRALMNESFSKSNVYQAEGQELVEEINSLVELIDKKNKLEIQNQALMKELESLKAKIDKKRK
ncbi:hypothetical protein LCGC14_0711500 [marine sediment metagenome]|uniref:Uncharacterized protein n=1 Tax=marine sediment metagenome TaxID=412755 RepID=A0A0F9QEV3_9ZZZZ